jgi:calcium binding protein 39
LILVMHLLRDTSPHITMDAFHVFKVFVANPNKPAEVIKILQDNRVKLCRYLTTLHPEKEASDTQFRDEKALIIATIEGL